ncbi:tRNA (adenine(22)-N(1))-methyltransferase TrmK [Candidatus Peregrinibacteria bacterium]|nr:tRNA (adenine(22)-N(1))-methyltransferase TrmK [Candidatus Peregrinibacteria bacterium]
MSPELLRFLEQMKRDGISRNIPNISISSGHILQFFLRIIGAKNVFEIGCANGFSTIFLADALRDAGGKLVTSDVSQPSFEEAQENLSKVHLSKYVDFRFGDAVNVLDEHEKFDLIFIDGQKNRTHEFFEFAKKHLFPRGIILVDNTAKFPKKMEAFTKLRNREFEFFFFDILLDASDMMTVAFCK